MNRIINKKCLIIAIVGCLFIFSALVIEPIAGSLIKHILIAIGLTLNILFIKKVSKASICNRKILTEENRLDYINSIIDSNTKLYNKEYLQTNFTKVFDCNPSMFKESICVFIDIDNFTKLKNKFGESNSDVVVKELGKIICRSKREGDFAFKYSKDQFVIFYMNTNKDLIFDKVDTIRDEFKKYTLKDFLVPGTNFTLSIGTTQYQYGEDLNEIVHRADKAMYVSKYSGKDKISTL
jgi:diguanylate cyclase (GGDEF)-like protein